MSDDLFHPGCLVREISIHWIRVPLHTPYRLSYRTFHEFEPFLVRVADADGNTGWGEAHISPGSSIETREGGWQFCADHAMAILGKSTAEARCLILAQGYESPVAATAIVSALEVLGKHRILTSDDPVEHELLAPLGATEPAAIEREVERWIAEGYATFKVKVGKDVTADLERVRNIQKAARGRARLRIDANRAFDRAEAISFATGLNPEGVELFEQPCATEAWADNAAVAAVSNVPVMLDEPICSLEDITRASDIPGVKFCKIKLKRFLGIGRLVEALESIRAHGMGAVLGDGLGADVSAWIEGMAGAGRIHGAGEFNGFLKLQKTFLRQPLVVSGARVTIPAAFAPDIDDKLLKAYSLSMMRFKS